MVAKLTRQKMVQRQGLEKGRGRACRADNPWEGEMKPVRFTVDWPWGEGEKETGQKKILNFCSGFKLENGGKERLEMMMFDYGNTIQFGLLSLS